MAVVSGYSSCSADCGELCNEMDKPERMPCQVIALRHLQCESDAQLCCIGL
jgi:hypothetical protein